MIQAASAGDPDAQFNLGVLYDNRLDDNGHAIGGNRVEAIRWLLAAARQGLPRAQFRLAELYVAEPGESGGRAEACFWFLLAGKSLVGIHRERARSGYDRASADMTPRQIALATGRARRWKPTAQASAGSDLRDHPTPSSARPSQATTLANPLRPRGDRL